MLHLIHVLLKDSSLLLCLKSFFFQMSYWHVTTTIFITCRWTFIKQRRKLIFFHIRGNWIWFFIPSKHLFTDRVNPINCFNPCICLQSILHTIVTKHAIKVNEYNCQRMQIWGSWMFSQTFHMWSFYHMFTFKNKNKLYLIGGQRLYIKDSCRKHPVAMITIISIHSNLAFSLQM